MYHNTSNDPCYPHDDHAMQTTYHAGCEYASSDTCGASLHFRRHRQTRARTLSDGESDAAHAWVGPSFRRWPHTRTANSMADTRAFNDSTDTASDDNRHSNRHAPRHIPEAQCALKILMIH